MAAPQPLPDAITADNAFTSRVKRCWKRDAERPAACAVIITDAASVDRAIADRAGDARIDLLVRFALGEADHVADAIAQLAGGGAPLECGASTAGRRRRRQARRRSPWHAKVARQRIGAGKIGLQIKHAERIAAYIELVRRAGADDSAAA